MNVFVRTVTVGFLTDLRANRSPLVFLSDCWFSVAWLVSLFLQRAWGLTEMYSTIIYNYIFKIAFR